MSGSAQNAGKDTVCVCALDVKAGQTNGAWREESVSDHPSIYEQRTSLPLTLQNALQGSFKTPKLWTKVQCGSRTSISSKDN